MQIEWERGGTLPPSRPAAIPGGGSMRLGDGEMQATEENVNGEYVYRTSAVLTIAAGSAVGQARVRCQMRGGPRSELGRTVNSRGAFPRSSGEYNLTKQDVPGSVGIRLPIRGAEYASLEFADAFEAFTETARRRRQLGAPQGEIAGMAVGPAGRAPGEAARARLRRLLAHHGAVARPHFLHAGKQRRCRDRPDSRRPHRVALAATSSSGPSIPLPTLFSFGFAG